MGELTDPYWWALGVVGVAAALVMERRRVAGWLRAATAPHRANWRRWRQRHG